MLPNMFMSLRIWDRILIIGFIIFSVYLIACLIIMTAPERRRRLRRTAACCIPCMTGPQNGRLRPMPPHFPTRRL